MKKIVFFDIDGTLLDHDKNLPQKTKSAIRQLKEQGTFVAIATGRAPFMFESLRDELDIDSFVSFNGQYVVFENECVYSNPLDHNKLEALLHDSQENQHPLVFMDEKTMKTTVSNHPFILESMRSLKFPHPEKDEDFYQNRNIYQTLLFCESSHDHFYVHNHSSFRFVRWHPVSVDVIPAGGSKAEGIRKMIEILGFNIKDVYAFGDGLNDIEMFQAVGTAVAMGNAVDEVKELAKFVTKDVSDDGIWHGLKELELI